MLKGGAGDDTLRGMAGDDVLDGEGGDDLLEPGVDGGSNIGGSDGTAGGVHSNTGDTVSYVGLSAGVTATLGGASTGSASAGAPDALSQSLNEIENLTGGSGNDTLSGDGAKNILKGGRGMTRWRVVATSTISTAARTAPAAIRRPMRSGRRT